jgi:hypothetical protein
MDKKEYNPDRRHKKTVWRRIQDFFELILDFFADRNI